MPNASEARRVLNVFESRLSALPNVVGLGIQEREDALEIVVYVNRKVPTDTLNPAEVIPRELEVEGLPTVKTRVVESGPINAESESPGSDQLNS